MSQHTPIENARRDTPPVDDRCPKDRRAQALDVLAEALLELLVSGSETTLSVERFSDGEALQNPLAGSREGSHLCRAGGSLDGSPQH